MADWDVVNRNPVRSNEELIAQHFPEDAVDVATKIMMAESSGEPSAINVNTNKSQDRGLFQVNDVWVPELQEQGIIGSPEDLMNPETNIRAASYIYNKQGTDPWNASKERWGGGGEWDVVSRKPSGEFDHVPESFEFPEETVGQEGMSPGGLVRNVGRNILDIGRGIYSLFSQGPELAEFVQKYDPTSPMGIYHSVTEPEPLKQMGSEVGKSLLEFAKHPVRTAYEHPVDVGLMVSPLAELTALKTASKLPTFSKVMKGVAKVTDQPAGIIKATAKLPEFEAARLINSRLRPKDRQYWYGKNPGLGVTREKIVATSLGDLEKKITVRWNQVGQQIENITTLPKYSGMRMNLSSTIDEIDQAIIRASRNPKSNASLITRLTNAKEDLLQAYQLPTGQVAYTRNLSSMSPQEALQFKRDIGDITKWTNDLNDDNVVNKALKRAYGTVDSELDRAIPELKELNERYANLTGARVAARNRERVVGKHNLLSLPSIGFGIGAGMISGETLTGIGVAILYQTLSTTLPKTAVARVLSEMGYRMPQIATTIGTAGRAGVLSNVTGISDIEKTMGIPNKEGGTK